MEQILKSDYGKDTALAAVLGGTDESARGVIRAVSRSYRGKNDVIVTGSGTDSSSLKELENGDQTMSAYVDTQNEAIAASDVGLSLMTEESTDSYLIEKSGWSFSCRYDTTDIDGGKGVIPSFLIGPVKVTKKNAASVMQ